MLPCRSRRTLSRYTLLDGVLGSVHLKGV